MPDSDGGAFRGFAKAGSGMARPALSADVLGDLCKNMPGLAEKLEQEANLSLDVQQPSQPMLQPKAAAFKGGPGSSGFGDPPGLSMPKGGMPMGLPRMSPLSVPPGPYASLPPGMMQVGKRGYLFLPGVEQLCDKFSIDESLAKLLDERLRARSKTWVGDLETVQAFLESASTPASALMVVIKQMQQSNFVGMPPNHKIIHHLATRFQLDSPAQQKLAGTLTNLGTERAKAACEMLEKHLERSNKPSAIVMMNLAKIRKGEDLGIPTHRPAPGSYLYATQEAERRKKDEECEALNERLQRGRRGAGDRRDDRDRGDGRRDDRDRNRDRRDGMEDRDRRGGDRKEEHRDARRDRKGDHRDDRRHEKRESSRGRERTETGKDRDRDRDRDAKDTGRERREKGSRDRGDAPLDRIAGREERARPAEAGCGKLADLLRGNDRDENRKVRNHERSGNSNPWEQDRRHDGNDGKDADRRRSSLLGLLHAEVDNAATQLRERHTNGRTRHRGDDEGSNRDRRDGDRSFGRYEAPARSRSRQRRRAEK